jgi:hypothetical protein
LLVVAVGRNMWQEGERHVSPWQLIRQIIFSFFDENALKPTFVQFLRSF